MKAEIEFTIHNLEAAERATKELLEHIEAIKNCSVIFLGKALTPPCR